MEKKRAKRKWPLAVGVVVAVLVVAGAGFWAWHEQPSFCNAICHEPMDPYVEGYYDNEALEAHAHQVEGVTCLQCHEAKLDEQISEGVAWITGNYEVDENGMIATVGVRSDAAMCATSGCHDWPETVAATENWGGEAGVNPHESHQGYALDCSSCHTEHGASIMYCNTCHDYEVPDGWTAPAKASAPADAA
ncbi:MAG: cytochrome c3 family protein [Eggerthellaceae bacterium]|nr:cytochrome c3 family protein [Eggerthellaceae bacterium]